MPSPYAEPASTYLGYITAYGKGSVPGQAVVRTWAQHNNNSPVTLTGSPASIATGTVIVESATDQQVIVQVSVAAQATGGAAQLHVDVEVDGDSLFPGGELIQPSVTDGCVCTYQISFDTLVGTHTLSLLAFGTGDGTLTIAAHQGNLMLLVATV